MNAQAIAQIANHLNVSPNQVKRCEEWASVLFVQVHGHRPRFVSKKVIQVMEIKRAQGWEEHRYEVSENGTTMFRVFQKFNGWYVKPATDWRTVERPDICALAQSAYEAENRQWQQGAEVRQQIAAQQREMFSASRSLSTDESLECWLGEGA